MILNIIGRGSMGRDGKGEKEREKEEKEKERKEMGPSHSLRFDSGAPCSQAINLITGIELS